MDADSSLLLTLKRHRHYVLDDDKNPPNAKTAKFAYKCVCIRHREISAVGHPEWAMLVACTAAGIEYANCSNGKRALDVFHSKRKKTNCLVSDQQMSLSTQIYSTTETLGKSYYLSIILPNFDK